MKLLEIAVETDYHKKIEGIFVHIHSDTTKSRRSCLSDEAAMSQSDQTRRQALAFGVITQFVGTTLYGVSSFALSIVILRETGSLWAYAGNSFAAAAITAFFGPVAGIAVDSVGRTKVVSIAALANVALASLALFADGFSQASILFSFLLTAACCVLTSCSAIVSISLPRLLASTVDRVGSHLNSIQISEQCARIISPFFLFLFYPISFREIGFTVTFLSFFLLLAALGCQRGIGALERRATTAAETEKVDTRPSLSNMVNYIAKDRVLRVLAVYLAISTACVELAATGLTPVAISFSSEAMLGLSFTMANVAAVCGSIAAKGLTNLWNKRFALKIFLCIEAIGGVLIAVESQTDSIVIFTTALAAGFFILPASLIAAQVAWLGDAPKTQQGILSGLERTSSWSLVPLAYLVGPLLVPPTDYGSGAFAVETFRTIVLVAAILLILSSLLAWILMVSPAPQRNATN